MGKFEGMNSSPEKNLKELTFDEILTKYDSVVKKNREKGERYIMSLKDGYGDYLVDSVSNANSNLAIKFIDGFDALNPKEMMSLIAYYQDLNGLKVDGILGKKTSASAERFKEGEKKKEAQLEASGISLAELDAGISREMNIDNEIKDLDSIVVVLKERVSKGGDKKAKYEELLSEYEKSLKTLKDNKKDFLKSGKVSLAELHVVYGTMPAAMFNNRVKQIEGIKIPAEFNSSKSALASRPKGVPAFDMIKRRMQIRRDLQKMRSIDEKLKVKEEGGIPEAASRAKIDRSIIRNLLEEANTNSKEYEKDKKKMEKYVEKRDQIFEDIKLHHNL